ncbi:MAG TPA: trypsin-like peptidase domain-containing protein [Candidatus Baltobacteraceae bacterium]|jgi:serine protease Do|nr:trypsin-like peptidase domain-containing protein [Candidatus Baltobacteraceae bacterium]
MNTFKTGLLGAVAAAAVLAGAGLAVAGDTSPIDLARQLNEAFIEVADQASSSVVVIKVTAKATDEDGDDSGSLWDALPPELRRYFEEHSGHRRNRPHKVQAEGSGIIVSPDGYILTNNHVVENAEKIIVRFKDGREFSGEVKGTDPESDVAVVKIPASGLSPAKLGDSDATRVGEFVLAIGAPFTLSYSVTFGHVSAKGRSFEGSGQNYADQDFIQTDASINPGNSGGPLVNLYGEVIAVNTMIEGMNTGIGFAIPINLAKRVMAHLIDEGKYTRSWLGVRIYDLRDDPDYQTLDSKLTPDVKDGVVVWEISSDGPAGKSDLRPGDVITAVDDKVVKTSRELKNEIAAKPPGHVTVLNVVRAKEHLLIRVTVAALPPEQEMAAEMHPSNDKAEAVSLGLTVEPMSKALASRYGIDEVSGVVVTEVEQDSAADESGLKPGDVITEINRKRISNPRQFRDAVKSADAKGGIMVNLISNGASRFIVLKDNGK